MSGESPAISLAISSVRKPVLGDAALLQAGEDRLGGGLGVGADVEIGGAQPLPQAARVDVDLDDAGAGIEIAALGRVVAERRADADHEVGFGELLAREVAGEGAGDVERIGIAVEQALAEERRRRQRTRPARPAPRARRRRRTGSRRDRRSGSASRPRRSCRRPVDDHGIGHRPLGRRHQVGRGRVVGQVRPSLLLHVHRHAQHDRASARAAPPGRLRARCRAGGRHA